MQVLAEFVENWDDADKAVNLYQKLKKQGVDVVYPAGDGYNIPVIEQIKTDNLSAIGYVTDQSNLGSHTVLTSTVQHVDKAYSIIAKKFNEGKLNEQGEYSFDFKEGVIEMGKFSSTIDRAFVKDIEKDIANYKKQANCQMKSEDVEHATRKIDGVFTNCDEVFSTSKRRIR